LSNNENTSEPMTPREKAEEITLVYYNLGKHLYVPISFAKQCALIAVDEILQSNNLYNSIKTKFYLEVKQEIEKL
jgi:hypothetical protein